MKQFKDARAKIKLFFSLFRQGKIEKENIREVIILSSALKWDHVYWINAFK